jgi:hypothetical protein
MQNAESLRLDKPGSLRTVLYLLQLRAVSISVFVKTTLSNSELCHHFCAPFMKVSRVSNVIHEKGPNFSKDEFPG